MKYKVIARDRVFYEGKSLNQAEKIVQEVSQMICAGLSTSYKVDEFKIMKIIDSQ